MICGGRQKLSVVQWVGDIMISISCAEGIGTNSVDPILGISIECTNKGNWLPMCWKSRELDSGNETHQIPASTGRTRRIEGTVLKHVLHRISEIPADLSSNTYSILPLTGTPALPFVTSQDPTSSSLIILSISRTFTSLSKGAKSHPFDFKNVFIK